MILTIQLVLFLFTVLMLVASLFYSIRYRREQEARQRGLYAAKMNICMGILLVTIAVMQLFFFTDSNTRRVFGTICLLLGLFNFFAGVRNYGAFQRMNR